MAASLFALLDDMATILDDVATLTKVAAGKTAGVVGDDLAVNANQVTGLAADRELPVVRKVVIGSLKNKLILVPAALLASVLLPLLIPLALVLGGLFLCFEGAEKLLERWLHTHQVEQEEAALHAAVQDVSVDLETLENEKVQGAIRTDLVLSGEIIVITLGEVAHVDWFSRLLVLSAVGLALTVGVYGLVAMIVKIDDLGFYLQQRGGVVSRPVGQGLLWLAPKMMRVLAVVGTIAMFVVGGSILLHQMPGLPEAVHHLSGLGALLLDATGGLLAGLVVVGLHALWQRMRGQSEA